MGLLFKENIKIQKIKNVNQFGDILYEEPFVIHNVEIERYPLFETVNNMRLMIQGAKITVFSSDDYSAQNLLNARAIDDNYKTYYITNIKTLKNIKNNIIRTAITLKEKGGGNGI
ncbi:hypothetical protein [Lactococcus petauri]|uniref:hypothetical protein n=1 Tax=Lactococcus petauri TaxID=1940789 RepID=UPI00254C2B01|nr:hypothetical protein [Lactococcus petauri]